MPLEHHILALVFHDFEALDLFGPLGAIIPRSDYYTLNLVNVHNFTSPHGLESTIKNGIGIIPTMSITNALQGTDPFDTLFIPGGLGMIPLLDDPMLLKKVGQLVDRARNVFTVCTGSLILAATGRLDGREATCNKRIYDEMTPKYPNVRWERKARWVEDGKFLTSSGITAGLDAGFAFLAKTYLVPESRSKDVQLSSDNGDETFLPNFDKEKAREYARSIALTLEYRWNDDPRDDPFAGELGP